MLWINLGLICLIGALLIALAALLQPRLAAVGRVLTTLGLQLGGVLVVTWLLVERGQAISRALPPPPGTESTIFAQIEIPAVASLLLALVALFWGTGFGIAGAAFAVGAKRPRLALVLGAISLIWVIPTFLLAILAQDLQTQIYNMLQVNVTGGYAQFSAGQLAWSAAVLAIRPAAYAYRQCSILIADQSRQMFVRTALSKGLPWGMIVRRHIVRPAAAGILRTASASIRLMFGSLPLVEFFFGYPGLGELLLRSLGVSSGLATQPPDPGLAIASAVVLASILAVLEAVLRVLMQKADPRVAEQELEAAA
ncbi:MAG TPA: ABC transporter permease subunit [Candidatus Dormibacteraeota bacterium]|nr:ABC transporter permease subunit [Candidatus Dormibacteraeota bacterium]